MISIQLRSYRRVFAAIISLVVMVFGARVSHAADSTNMKTLPPEELVRLLSAKDAKPLLLDVGSHMLFVQAHIPGSEYVGAGNTPKGIQRLRQRAQNLSKKTAIVL